MSNFIETATVDELVAELTSRGAVKFRVDLEEGGPGGCIIRQPLNVEYTKFDGSYVSIEPYFEDCRYWCVTFLTDENGSVILEVANGAKENDKVCIANCQRIVLMDAARFKALESGAKPIPYEFQHDAPAAGHG